MEITKAEAQLINIWRTITPGGEMLVKSNATRHTFSVMTKNVTSSRIEGVTAHDLEQIVDLLQPFSKVELHTGTKTDSASVLTVQTNTTVLEY